VSAADFAELEKNVMGPFKILKVAFEELMTPSDEENKLKWKQVMVWSQKQRNHKLLTYWEFQFSHFTPFGRYCEHVLNFCHICAPATE
jgi:hypothetical protein